MRSASYEIIDDLGAGAPWLLMVHGISQNRRVFSNQVSFFRATYRLLLVDLPGHGLSSDIPGPYGLDEYAASIAGAMDDAGVTGAVFWGTHLGAAAGLLLGCREAARFSALILEGPVFPGRSMPAVAQVLASVGETARIKGLAAARKLWWEEVGWFDVMRDRPEECRAVSQIAIIDEFEGAPWLDPGLIGPVTLSEENLRTLGQPVLIMNGEHDLPDFLKAANDLSALIPDCRRVSVRDGGGFPFWEFPDRVNKKVRAFLHSL